MPLIRSLPYQTDNKALFSKLSHLPWAVWLDSQGMGSHELVSALPRATHESSSGHITVTGDVPDALRNQPAFQALDTLLAYGKHLMPANPALSGMLFQGGIIGFWGYDSANSIDGTPPGSDFPDAAFGLYDWFIHIDHTLQRCDLVFLDCCPASKRQAILTLLQEEARPQPAFYLTTPFTALTPRQQYAADIRRIQDYILAGDCYQVNYAQAFDASYAGSPWEAYQTLRADSRSPFSAFINTEHGQILSLSPERFLSVEQHHILTQPIKGTRPRLPDPVADREAAESLLRSSKDLAENVMITDLLRNDISRHAEVGSVRVEKLCALESFSLVHHLVSTISARLKPDSTAARLLADAFPGGSITGAPKKRAMEIIAELEATPRSVYCGSIGYFSVHGRMDSNITIRTLRCSSGKIRAWAGGGITADSRWEDEYQECLNKIGGILRRLEELEKPD